MSASKVRNFKSKSRPKKKEAEIKENENDDDFDVDEALRMSIRMSVEEDESKKRNKIYLQLKREIEQREKSKPVVDAAEEVFFVDKQRNMAVVIGVNDLKTDVKNKKKKDKQKEEEEDNDEPDHAIFITQAIYELRGGSAEIALEYMNAAMKLEPDDDMNYIIRSQCLIKLGRVSEAINDAEIALKLNPRALQAKAEALYAEGEFEMALVNFERGWKIRHDQEIKYGIKKCREAILLTLGRSKKIDVRMVKLVINEMKINSTLRENNSTKSKRSTKGKLKMTAAKVIKSNNDNKLLGEMNTDRKFLEKFLQQQTWRQKEENDSGFVNNLASDALKYLEERKHFWGQTVMKTK